MTAAAPRTRFEAYGDGVARGEADRAAGLAEPRAGVWKEAPGARAAYILGYRDGFGLGDEADRLPQAPVLVDAGLAAASALLRAWAARRRPGSRWRAWLVVGAVTVAEMRVHTAAQRLAARRRRHGDVMPPLPRAGRFAKALGISFGLWLLRRGGALGDDAATRLGRNLAVLIVLRLDRRADERRWRDYQR